MTRIPMPELFRACVAVLTETLRPWHYADLTRAGLERLGKAAADSPRLREDVREKLLLARQHGTAYTGAPLYLAVLSRWFPHEQRLLLNGDMEELSISVGFEPACAAAFELVMRAPHMQSKVTDSERRWQAMPDGFADKFRLSVRTLSAARSAVRDAVGAVS